jgi:hypothetical protein
MSRTRSRFRPAARPRSRRGADEPRAFAGELLPVLNIGADGLLIRDDGAYVRAIEVTPINPLILEEDAARRVNGALGTVQARLAAGESLMLYAQADPLPLGELLAFEQAKCERAAATQTPERAQATRRLQAAAAHSLRVHAPALAAVSMRYAVICPFRVPAVKRRRRGSGVLALDSEQHRRAVEDSLRHAEGIRTDLEACGLRAQHMPGAALLDLIWSRSAPDHADAGELPPSATQPDVLSGPLDAQTPEEADALARQLRTVLTPDRIGLPDRHHIQLGQSVERVAWVSGVPEQTWLGWLLHLMQSPRPFALAVHVHATDRYRERMAQRRRARRIAGVNDGARDRGRRPSPEARQQEAEAEELTEELSTSAGSGIYRVSIYLALREPGLTPDTAALDEDARALAREAITVADLRTQPGQFAQRELWRSTLPLGVDYGRRQRSRKHVTRTAADTTPLVGTRCGSPLSPTSQPLGYAHPGRSIEHLDPFDAEHENHLIVINGRSGTGKTVLANVITARAQAQGAVGYVIDRAGHFDFHASLIPDARTVAPGGPDRHAINPWDTPDLAHVPRSRIAFLLGLHDLLIGGKQGLDGLQSALLDVAIRAVYDRCRITGEAPRELLLQEELTRMCHEERDGGDPQAASILNLLVKQLASFVGEGAYAYLADWPTSVPEDSSFVVFDTRHIPDDYRGAAMFAMCDYITETIARRRERYLAGSHGPDEPGWGGKAFLVLDELWKLLRSPRTGAWVEEFARRSRHIALCVIAITQQLEDLDNEWGRALMKNAAIKLFLRQEPKELEYIRSAVELTDAEVEAIGSLVTAKRQYSTVFVANGTRGRGKLSIRVSAPEYWLATNEPIRDEPIRRRALREAEGDGWLRSWNALKLLCDPDFHEFGLAG